MDVLDRNDPLRCMFIQMNRDLFLSEDCKQCWLKFYRYFTLINRRAAS